MLKTIKTTKYLNLHELIKYVWENDITEREFKCETNSNIFVHARQNINVIANGFGIREDDLFKVEIEEEITEETMFDTLVSTYIPLGGGDIFIDVYSNHSIKDIIETDKMHGVKTERIYALIDGKLQLIWERENQ